MINRTDVDQADRVIDEAIAKVDQSLPAIRKIGASKKQKRATDRLPSDQARCAFKDMSNDPLLNAEGTDICLCKDGRHKDGPCRGKCRSAS